MMLGKDGEPTTLLFFEVLGYETGLPVKIAVWHVRSVRPIREAALDNETVTRIELANGDVLDCSDPVADVLTRIGEALQPVEQWLGMKDRRRATSSRSSYRRAKSGELRRRSSPASARG